MTDQCHPNSSNCSNYWREQRRNIIEVNIVVHSILVVHSIHVAPRYLPIDLRIDSSDQIIHHHM